MTTLACSHPTTTSTCTCARLNTNRSYHHCVSNKAVSGKKGAFRIVAEIAYPKQRATSNKRGERYLQAMSGGWECQRSWGEEVLDAKRLKSAAGPRRKRKKVTVLEQNDDNSSGGDCEEDGLCCGQVERVCSVGSDLEEVGIGSEALCIARGVQQSRGGQALINTAWVDSGYGGGGYGVREAIRARGGRGTWTSNHRWIAPLRRRERRNGREGWTDTVGGKWERGTGKCTRDLRRGVCGKNHQRGNQQCRRSCCRGRHRVCLLFEETARCPDRNGPNG